MRSRPGFTLTELAIVLSLLGLLVPLVWRFALGLEDQRSIALWHLATADAVRTLSEELALLDRGSRRLAPDLAWDRQGCTLRLEHDPGAGAIVRNTSPECGGSQVLARGVETLLVVPGGVEVTFLLPLRPNRAERSTLFLPLEAP